jgi:glucose/arabinose dehydrogenase
VTGGLSNPVFAASAQDGANRLYVVEQGGTVRVVTKGHVHARLYLDVRNAVACCGEQGLLSVAFHPHFSRHPFVYVAYTRASDGALEVARFRATGGGATHVLGGSKRHIITVPHPGQSNHNAGQLLFTPGGMLLISTGDGGGGGDAFDNARNLTSLSGKLLRLDVDRSCGNHHYCIPPNNPFPHSSSANKRTVLDWGLRNPWRMSVDRADGRLWLADVGQDEWEEIDHVRLRGGKDFGWSCREGMHSYNSSRCTIGGKPRHMIRPLREYHHDTANGVTRCAVIGGYAYHGPRYPFAHGLYVFGDYCTGELWAIGRTSTGGWSRAKVGDIGQTYSITGFGQSDSGELYAVTQGGSLYHLALSRTG